jgi:ankyrin repeat protein
VVGLLIGAVVLVVAFVGCRDDADGREGGPRKLDRRLLAAAYVNDVAAARRLIDAGADVNAKDETEQSAYLIATSEVGDDPRLLELALEAGADVNAKDRYNGTGLIRAAERGHAAIVGRLLRTDVAVDHVNRLGWTAVLEAVILGEGGPAHIATVRLLVDAGADVSIPDESGTTALEHARRRGFAEIERILRRAD